MAAHNVNIRDTRSVKIGGRAETIYFVQSKPDHGVLAELRGVANVYRVTD